MYSFIHKQEKLQMIACFACIKNCSTLYMWVLIRAYGVLWESFSGV